MSKRIHIKDIDLAFKFLCQLKDGIFNFKNSSSYKITLPKDFFLIKELSYELSISSLDTKIVNKIDKTVFYISPPENESEGASEKRNNKGEFTPLFQTTPKPKPLKKDFNDHVKEFKTKTPEYIEKYLSRVCGYNLCAFDIVESIAEKKQLMLEAAIFFETMRRKLGLADINESELRIRESAHFYTERQFTNSKQHQLKNIADRSAYKGGSERDKGLSMFTTLISNYTPYTKAIQCASRAQFYFNLYPDRPDEELRYKLFKTINAFDTESIVDMIEEMKSVKIKHLVTKKSINRNDVHNLFKHGYRYKDDYLLYLLPYTSIRYMNQDEKELEIEENLKYYSSLKKLVLKWKNIDKKRREERKKQS